MSNRLNGFGMGSNVWSDKMQLFATRGYAALAPDIPLKVGSPMRDIAKDVVPGVNKVIDMGIADRNRIGVMGMISSGRNCGRETCGKPVGMPPNLLPMVSRSPRVGNVRISALTARSLNIVSQPLG